MKSNLDPKVESTLCYVPCIGWVAAIIFLIIEKNAQVRFDAAQALLITLIGMVFFWFPFVLPAAFVLQIVLAVFSYQEKKTELPILGDLAKKVLEAIASKKK
jgi:uncharacterized membrane protein